MTQNDNTDDETDHTRRRVLAGVAGLGVLGAGFSAGQATAQSVPEGEVGTSSNPYLRAHIERKRYLSRSSDPSSPADGTTWYRGDV